MKLANATKLDRKSGAAEWRDLRCASPSSNSAAFKAFTLGSCLAGERTAGPSAPPDFLSKTIAWVDFMRLSSRRAA